MITCKDVKSFCPQDFTPLFYAISRLSPHVGAATSFLNATHDLFDLVITVFKNDVRERPKILKAALGRFCSNSLIGIANMTPIICIAAFMLTNPLILPIVAIHPVCTDFIKFYHLVNAGIKEVREKKILYLAHPTKKNREDFIEAEDYLYSVKQQLAISACLVIGAVISAAGVFFPPLLLVGIIFSVSVALLGFIDKRYQCTRKIHAFFFGNDTYIPCVSIKPSPCRPAA